MEESTVKKHVTMVGALHIGFGTIGVIGAIILHFVMGFASSFVKDVEVASTVLNFLSTGLPLIIGVISVIKLAGGIGLLSFQKWARIFVLIVSAIGCLNIPVGTVIGVYSIWVLMQDDVIRMFK